MTMGAEDESTSPVTVGPGQVQSGVDPRRLHPSRSDLITVRLDFQRGLLRSGKSRFTMIQVTQSGIIIDGHHRVRAAAEEGVVVDVIVTPLPAKMTAESILDLEVH